MKKHKHLIIYSIVIFLTFIAFICSIASEFKRAKEKDLKRDSGLCSMPKTPAFGLGFTAVVCLSVAQIVGTSAGEKGSSCSKGKKKKTTGNNKNNKKTFLAIVLLVSSWLSYGLAVVLLATAANMNGHQPYGRGWLDGKCYVVKPGVFAGAGLLIIITTAFTLGFNIFTFKEGTESSSESSPERVPTDEEETKKADTFTKENSDNVKLSHPFNMCEDL